MRKIIENIINWLIPFILSFIVVYMFLYPIKNNEENYKNKIDSLQYNIDSIQNINKKLDSNIVILSDSLLLIKNKVNNFKQTIKDTIYLSELKKLPDSIITSKIDSTYISTTKDTSIFKTQLIMTKFDKAYLIDKPIGLDYLNKARELSLSDSMIIYLSDEIIILEKLNNERYKKINGLNYIIRELNKKDIYFTNEINYLEKRNKLFKSISAGGLTFGTFKALDASFESSLIAGGSAFLITYSYDGVKKIYYSIKKIF